MSEHSGYPGAPPGWYEDPAGGPGQRWWDGYTWTRGHRAAPTARLRRRGRARPHPSGPPAQMAPWAVASERLNTFSATQARRRRAAHGAAGALRRGDARPSTSSSASSSNGRTPTSCAPPATSSGSTGNDAQHGITPPPYHAPSNSCAPIGLLVGALTVAAVIIACIWQHKAAIGRTRPRHPVPATRRPGASVVGSCRSSTCGCPTPPSATASRAEHPHRPRVLHWWIALLLAGFLSDRGRHRRPVLDRNRPRPVHPRRARLPGRDRLGTRHCAWRSRRRTRRRWRAAGPRNRGVPGVSHARLNPSLRQRNSNLRTVHLGIALLLLDVHLASLRSW